MAIKILTSSDLTDELITVLKEEGFNSTFEPKAKTRALDILEVISLTVGVAPYLERVVKTVVIKYNKPVRITTRKKVIKVTPQQLQDSKTIELINQIGSSDDDAVIEFV